MRFYKNIKAMNTPIIQTIPEVVSAPLHQHLPSDILLVVKDLPSSIQHQYTIEHHKLKTNKKQKNIQSTTIPVMPSLNPTSLSWQRKLPTQTYPN